MYVTLNFYNVFMCFGSKRERERWINKDKNNKKKRRRRRKRIRRRRRRRRRRREKKPSNQRV